jgi:hypothetical protein
MVVTSELTSNSVRHGASSFRVMIEQFADRIVIEVEDNAVGDPVMRSPGPTDTSGRGLQITKALSDSWGVKREQGSVGKTVWAVVLIPPAGAEELAQESAVRKVQSRDSERNRSISYAARWPSARSTLEHAIRRFCLRLRQVRAVSGVPTTYA